MDEKAIRRAALVTVRRAILERFPPGRERDAWLRWVERLAEKGGATRRKAYAKSLWRYE